MKVVKKLVTSLARSGLHSDASKREPYNRHPTRFQGNLSSGAFFSRIKKQTFRKVGVKSRVVARGLWRSSSYSRLGDNKVQALNTPSLLYRTINTEKPRLKGLIEPNRGRSEQTEMRLCGASTDGSSRRDRVRARCRFRLNAGEG